MSGGGRATERGAGGAGEHGLLRRYFREIGGIRVLTAAEEAELACGLRTDERELAAVAAGAVTKLRRDLPPAMTGEDFSFFLKEVPGAFVWIGNGPGDGGRELHNPAYDFNDAILPVASGYLVEVAKRALAGT